MKKEILGLLLTGMVSLGWADTYCPSTITCKNANSNITCVNMAGFHFGNTLPGKDGLYLFSGAYFDGGPGTPKAVCSYQLTTWNHGISVWTASIISNNLNLESNVQKKGNQWEGENYIEKCNASYVTMCPFKVINNK